MVASLVRSVVILVLTLSFALLSQMMQCPPNPPHKDVHMYAPGRCLYAFNVTQIPFESATNECRNLSENTSDSIFEWHLPKLDTSAKHDKSIEMGNKLQRDWGAWIGIRRDATAANESKWRWTIDNTTLENSSTQWQRNQPRANSECAILYSLDQKWYSYPCGESRGVFMMLCESITTIITTTTTTTTTTSSTSTSKKSTPLVTSATSEVNADSSTSKSKKNAFLLHWLFIGLGIVVAVIASGIIAGVCYSKRRSSQNVPLKSVWTEVTRMDSFTSEASGSYDNENSESQSSTSTKKSPLRMSKRKKYSKLAIGAKSKRVSSKAKVTPTKAAGINESSKSFSK